MICVSGSVFVPASCSGSPPRRRAVDLRLARSPPRVVPPRVLNPRPPPYSGHRPAARPLERREAASPDRSHMCSRSKGDLEVTSSPKSGKNPTSAAYPASTSPSNPKLPSLVQAPSKSSRPLFDDPSLRSITKRGKRCVSLEELKKRRRHRSGAHNCDPIWVLRDVDVDQHDQKVNHAMMWTKSVSVPSLVDDRKATNTKSAQRRSQSETAYRSVCEAHLICSESESVRSAKRRSATETFLRPEQASDPLPTAETASRPEQPSGPLPAVPPVLVKTALAQSCRAHKDRTDKTQHVPVQDVHDVHVDVANVVANADHMPEATEVIERLRAGTEGFSESDMARMESLFKRAQAGNQGEFHKDSLAELLARLGYVKIDLDDIMRLADSVTVYSVLEFSEFVEFMERFARYEREQWQRMYDKFDEDNSGTLEVSELRQLMQSLGFTPVRSAVREALVTVGCLEKGFLTFQEFVFLATVYRHTEGFARAEMKAFRRVFNKHGDRDGDHIALSAHKLQAVFMEFFGHQFTTVVTRVVTEVIGPELRGTGKGKDWSEVHALEFSEVLAWARHIREEEFKHLRREFERYDEDGSGLLEMEELLRLINDLGYTLFQASVQEALREAHMDVRAGLEDVTEVDFDDFVNLMVVFRHREGFSGPEVQQFAALFTRFDENNDGFIGTMELNHIMRYMGHRASLNDVRQMLAMVDWNKSGTLEFREFLRLMRLYREDELSLARKAFISFRGEAPNALRRELNQHKHRGHGGHVFTSFQDEKTHSMLVSSVPEALASLGFDQDCCDVSQIAPPSNKAPNVSVQQEMVTFEDFVHLVDQARASRAASFRRCAGFSGSELERFQRLFLKFEHDAQGGKRQSISNPNVGFVEPWQIADLLGAFGFVIQTKEEQQRIQGELDVARVTAKAAGIEDAEDPSRIGFLVFVHLLRVICNRDVKQALDREARAMEQTGFSIAEADEFREIFVNCNEKDGVSEDHEQIDSAHILLPVHKTRLREASGVLSKECIRRLLKSLGVIMTLQQRSTLDAVIAECGTHGKVDFVDFLRLMRWMLDTNFADIQGRTKGA